ncbi:OLC1v1009101C1 [Oldenlandia corymbosa var. corymbosa]|uniref:RING-type E3 ubiquitin transferase n=1 Tax=Oldenlandia corymbosa var. corymbosa TaxID=529605 RepID=A0AAV1DND7_OLDCO|nr:OLC1v1009101C1 [Oldenlandia corymbosa var. corymbosa]
MERIRYPDVDLRELSIMSSDSETVEERSSTTGSSIVSSPFPALINDETVYVAVGKEMKEAVYAFSWVLDNRRPNKIVILHVHQPSQTISMVDGPPIIRIHQRVRDHREAERKDAQKILDKYILHCQKAGVQAEKLFVEMESIEKGIVELISVHNIRRLVMGGAAKKHYTKKLMEFKSKKAIYVRQEAPPFCQIDFLCKGHLIYTREPMLVGHDTEGMITLLQVSPSTDQAEKSHSSRSKSVTERLSYQLVPSESAVDHARVMSENLGTPGHPPNEIIGVVPSPRSSSVERSSDVLSQKSLSLISFVSSSSSERMDDTAPVSNTRTEGNVNELHGDAPLHSEKDESNTSFRPEEEGTVNDELYHKLHQYMVEAENCRQEAYEETTKCRKAEREAIEARFQAKASESRCAEEVRKRKEVEEALALQKKEVEKMRYQLDEIKMKLGISMEQKSSLEIQIKASAKMVHELEQKMSSAVELLRKYKNERDDLQVECDKALKEVMELRQKHAEKESSSSMSYLFSEYLFSEIEQATCHFDPALKISEGGYGSIYKGFVRHTHVAIKILNQDTLQGPLEFQQEVNILSKFRHPNLVTLIGACPEACALIYEYLQNGSLEDRLNCKGNTPPLKWQTRIRIALEICAVLIFLHSCSPKSVVHGDLKPSNILLDGNYISKLSNFGICHILNENELSENLTTGYRRTDPKGTFAYMDPEFVATGELTPKSDVYSFGIILLRMLTGKPALGIVKEVQAALKDRNLKDILDKTAGDWPSGKAEQLVNLALSCCEMTRKNRPELSSEVWRVISPMRSSCGSTTSSSRLIPGEQYSHSPQYFICPIFQEIMKDPVVAADGYTYEAEAIRGWIDGGHDTSPMTNLKLTHTNLVPNLVLRSAIQEWSLKTRKVV